VQAQYTVSHSAYTGSTDADGYPTEDAYATPVERLAYGIYPLASQLNMTGDYDRRVVTSKVSWFLMFHRIRRGTKSSCPDRHGVLRFRGCPRLHHRTFRLSPWRGSRPRGGDWLMPKRVLTSSISIDFGRTTTRSGPHPENTGDGGAPRKHRR
jgi:hypothetical protein